MKKLVAMVVACAAIFGATACGSTDSNTVNLGFIGNLSGGAKYYGEQVQKGINLAVEEINKDGGVKFTVNGTETKKQIKVFAQDDAGEASQASMAYSKIKGKVCAIVGPVLSGASESVANLANKDGIPMITPSGSAESLTKDRPFVFRTCLTDPSQGTYLANFASAQEYKKIVVLKNTSSAYSKGVCEFFNEQYVTKLGKTVAKTVEYTDENYTTNLDSFVTTIMAENPDCIILPDYTKVNYAFAQAIHAKEAGKNVVFLGADGWDGIISGEGVDAKYLDNVFFTNNLFSGDKSEKIQNFYSAFKTKYKTEDISAFAALAYDAVYLYRDAIEKANTTDKTSIKNTLKSITFQGVTGKITFDAQGNPNREVPIIEIKSGEYTLKTKITSEE